MNARDLDGTVRRRWSRAETSAGLPDPCPGGNSRDLTISHGHNREFRAARLAF
jgi:hypothetical protein